MKIDLDALSYEPRDVEFMPGVILKIRPYPYSKGDTRISDDGLVIPGDKQLELFTYCLTGWSGVTDANGKDLVCSDAVKQKIFDFNLEGMATFVQAKVSAMQREKRGLEKNS